MNFCQNFSLNLFHNTLQYFNNKLEKNKLETVILHRNPGSTVDIWYSEIKDLRKITNCDIATAKSPRLL
jgi:hypothetical protein